MIKIRIDFTGQKIRISVLNEATDSYAKVATIKLQSRKKYSLNTYWGLNFHKKNDFVQAGFDTDTDSAALQKLVIYFYRCNNWNEVSAKRTEHAGKIAEFDLTRYYGSL